MIFLRGSENTVSTDYDVVILGGGPVGSLMAVLCNDVGLSNIVIDRDAVPYQLPRAMVMDDEIQRLFHDHELGEWLTANTTRVTMADFVDAEHNRIMGAEIPKMGLLGVPPIVCHYQPELDTMLRAEAEKRGSAVRWGHTATALAHDDNGVRLTLDNGEVISGRWLVGCDGASSWTRKTVGLTLTDLGFDQEWLVVDVELLPGKGDTLPEGVRQYCDPVRPSTYVKGHARYRRWEFQVQEHEDASALNTEEGLWRLLQPWLTPAEAHIVRSAVYRFHAVVAPQWRTGSVFLAGDSCHQMPPFMGQGLNSGMRDAINLAWKMSFVKRGLADDRLLDTYSEERVAHVRHIVSHAADLGRLIDQIAGRASHGVSEDSGYGGARPQPFLEHGFVWGDNPRVGHQFWYHPDVSCAVRHDGVSCVVVAATDIELPRELTAIGAQLVVAPESAGESYAVVVRPDRYVAAVAGDSAELAAFAATLGSHGFIVTA